MSEKAKPGSYVPATLQRSHAQLRKEGLVDKTARQLITELAAILGASDLDGKHILDMGCGVKLTRVLINDPLPIGRYTGLDVDPTVIDFLKSVVTDERFAFQRIDIYNERYNPSGKPLDAATTLPVARSDYDAITGYSLFTHLNPHDFLHMARTMRAVAGENTRLVVTAFLDLHSDGGHGFIDRFSAKAGWSAQGMAKGGYLDVYPEDPLAVTLYDKDYAVALLAETGWQVVDIHDPTPAAQHTVVAIPIRTHAA